MQDGIVFWLTGLSGAGITTIGKLLYEILKKERALGVFVSLTIPFSLCSAKAGNEIKNDTTLQGKDIPEVVVKGREIVVKDDKLLIYLSNKIKKQSFDGWVENSFSMRQSAKACVSFGRERNSEAASFAMRS